MAKKKQSDDEQIENPNPTDHADFPEGSVDDDQGEPEVPFDTAPPEGWTPPDEAVTPAKPLTADEHFTPRRNLLDVPDLLG